MKRKPSRFRRFLIRALGGVTLDDSIPISINTNIVNFSKIEAELHVPTNTRHPISIPEEYIRECLAKELVEKVRDRMIFKMRYDELTLCTVFRGTLFVREDFGDND